MCILAFLAPAAGDLRLDSKFTYKYDLLADLSVDSYQGDAVDEPEVTLMASVTLSPVVASSGWWSVQLSTVKVGGNGKTTEVLDNSEPLFVQYTDKGVGFYFKDSHGHPKEGSLSNLMKSVAQLFQSHSNYLGSCTVDSKETAGQTVQVMTNCAADKELNRYSTHPLGIAASVQREATYKVAADKTVQEISTLDIIEYHLSGNKETRSRIVSNLKLKFISKEAQEEEIEEEIKNLQKLDNGLFLFPRCDDKHCSKVMESIVYSSSN